MDEAVISRRPAIVERHAVSSAPAAEPAHACRICGNAAGNHAYVVREMMFGSRESFEYFQCRSCGCLQIAEVPADLSRHYPAQYFSFRKQSRMISSPLRGFFDRRRVIFALHGRSPLGALASLLAKRLDYAQWVARAGLDTDAAVLDVGCGQGKLLLRMKTGGFHRCVGVDAFVPQTVRYRNGVTVYKCELAELSAQCDERFDLIMFHHSYEHMGDPAEVLADAVELLAPGGCILIRIPVADSYAFQTYREHWMSLDAPRHLYLHTRSSLDLLARGVGMRIYDTVCDATSSQFIGSELYRRDISMNMPERRKRLFSAAELRRFRRLSEQLNREQRGDQAQFYLVRADDPRVCRAGD